MFRTALVVLLVGLPIASHVLLPSPVLVPAPYDLLGIVVMLAGLGFMYSAWAMFKSLRTTFRLHVDSSTLVTAGPFRLSRNPMYLGMLAAILGLSILLGSASGFVFPALYFVAIDRLMVQPEERSLEGQFGAAYTQYRQRVRRWL